MNVVGLYKKLDFTTIVYLLVLLIVIASWAAVKRSHQKPQPMFVQAAEDVRADEKAHSLRLVNAGPQTLYFSDRPVRLAGNMRMEDYLKSWNHGKDSFAKNNPNATLSVFEPGRPDNTLVVVEISNPVVDGRDIVYTYKLLDGTMPANG